MKLIALTLFLLAGLITGCNRPGGDSHSPTTGPQSTITGVAGFTLGNRLPDEYRLETNEESCGIYYSPDLYSLTNLPPFQMLYLTADSNRTICSITLSVLASGMEANPRLWHDLVDMLGKKYGARKGEDGQLQSQAIFESAGRRIIASETHGTIDVIYEDVELSMNAHVAAESRRKSKAEDQLKAL